MIKTISPQELKQRDAAGEPLHVIDVRTPAEFREAHLSGARNMPLDRLDPHAVIRDHHDSQRPLYLICRSGSRAERACQQFANAGYADVVSIAGGTQACDEAGLSIVYGRKAMSLERQVRIALGFLVLLGVAFGWLLHPAFYGLSAFVGAGLIFAGITDTCAMAMMVARMPWNQVADEADEEAAEPAGEDAACDTAPCRT